MSQEHPNDLQGRPKLAHAIRTMPRWKWRLLFFALVLGCVGLAGQGASMFLRAPAPAVQTQPTQRSIGSSYVADSDRAPIQVEPSLTDKLTPFMSKFGFSLFVGITVGLIFRTFLRMTFIALALIVAVGAGLSYLHINVDMSAVKADTSQASSWLMDQGYRLRDVLFNALPSSTAAGVGFFLGFKKR